MPDLLVYTILVKEPEHYMPMFRLMLATFLEHADVTCDLLVVGTRECVAQVRRSDLRRVQGGTATVRMLHAMEVPSDPDLHEALLRKLDVVLFPSLRDYKQVLYLDCDILVRGSLRRVLRRAAARPDLFHAPAEKAPFNHPFFGFSSYTEEEEKRMIARGRKTFNDGSFVFAPNEEMIGHLRAIRALATSRPDLRRKFYDQSFFNHYLNARGIASVDAFDRDVVIFPKPHRRYARKVLVHFAGLGNYATKHARMLAFAKKEGLITLDIEV